MIISTNWLNDYVDHDLTVDDLSDLLTMAGLEVEGVEQIGSTLEGVIVGHILRVDPHPDADRLQVCTVDLGQNTPAVIVCGAPNVAAGQFVAVATIGTVLSVPSRENAEEKVDLKIKKSKIRGQVSEGMICSEIELGMSVDGSGILVLGDEAILGSPFVDWLVAQGRSATDNAIDISITPNRPDAVCHVGVARDVSAVTGRPLTLPEISVPAAGGSAAEQISITIDAPELCSEYVAILVSDIKIAPSPPWMQQRLITAGLRPRNNVVDITNYVMYELGQPLHAFDFDTLAGASIHVHATDSESIFTTLDGKERKLPAGTLMIADGDRDIAIAGIMGGENSEVSDNTTKVLLESAYFDPSHIRRTAKSLQLQTDASYRFERGVDPAGQARAAARAAELLVTIAGGTLVDGLVSTRTKPVQCQTVVVRKSRAELIIGVEIPAAKINELLTAIGFEIAMSDDSETFTCTVPSFRPDIEREIDVIEEIARLYGFDKIPVPVRFSVPDHPVSMPPQRLLREKTRDLLSSLGYREIYTNSMLRTDLAKSFLVPELPGGKFGGSVVETLNPISQEMASLRPSLLPGALAIAGYNANHGRKSLRYFEFGNIQIHAQSDASIVSGYTEQELLLILCSGDDAAQDWFNTVRPLDYFDVKGIAGAVLATTKLQNISFNLATTGSKTASISGTDLCQSYASIVAGDTYVGTVGELNSEVGKKYNISSPIYFVEINWSIVAELAGPGLRGRYEAFSRYPVIERDLAVSLNRNVPVGDVMDLIKNTGKPLLSGVSVFDIYEGDQIAADQKSVAFSLTFSANRTLVDKEVETRFGKIVKVLESELGARLRQ
ncbi:MAG: phenylalanine--tRNA ligase subunit beta [Bacteroidetes bacterium]|nr:MAG: phenylalanine--tRNA ligase subunit beta [Bacteroidota bacterium]